jgi:hypothetical protein
MSRAAAVLVASMALIAAIGSGAAASTPQATASKSCSVGNSRSYGTTYVLSISVSNTSCSSGRSVIRAFHACRPGKAGACHRRVLGYSCSERRFDKIRTQYSARVTCRKGSRVVKHTYEQFT